MADEIKDLSKSPSLKGRFAKQPKSLTPLEKEALAAQGLLKPDGITLTEEAFIPQTKLNLPPNIAAPIPLEELVGNAAEVTEQIQEIRGETADPAQVDNAKQLHEGLPPPDTDTPSPALDIVEDVTIPLGDLIRKSKDAVKCSHCGFDIRQTFDPPRYEETDKLNFIRHIMSDDGRFFKSYAVFGDNIKLQFRSRSQAELEALLEVAREEMKQDKLLGMGDVASQLQRYHMMASVASITTMQTNEAGIQLPVTRKFTALSARLNDNEAVIETVRKMDKEVFGSGRSTGLFNVVMSAWMEFEKLYGWFASKAHDSDFWTAVGGARS